MSKQCLKIQFQWGSRTHLNLYKRCQKKFPQGSRLTRLPQHIPFRSYQGRTRLAIWANKVFQSS